MGLARSGVEGVLGHFTTDQSVRAGVTTAAWSFAASYAPGLLPRTPVQQAAATGAVIVAHYEIGAALWSMIASSAAGTPGRRAGNRALLTAAAITAVGGKALEMQLRDDSRRNIWWGAAWSQTKLLSVVGLAGGLVTASDIVLHDALDLPRTPASTLALDLTMGGLMAGGTWARRRNRARRTGRSVPPTSQEPQEPPPSSELSPEESAAAASKSRRRGKRKQLASAAKTGAYVGGAIVGTSVGLGILAIAEQAGARLVDRELSSLVGEDLGEFGDMVGHGVIFGAFSVVGYFGLNLMRNNMERGASSAEPGYRDKPGSPFVSAGPRSSVDYDAIGREGRRFVSMRLSKIEIETVMRESAVEPVRVVIPREGSIAERARLAVDELVSTGGIDRSLICIAAPTGVGYVNYVMAEALEYLTCGDCAIVVPQYAYVPSALALNKTAKATDLQRAVIEAVGSELAVRAGHRQVRVVQYGESLGAQVAADVGGVHGIAGFDEAGLSGGVYLGIPFRSSLWRSYLRDPQAMTASQRVIVVPDSRELRPNGDGRHVIVTHHDDPITKFAYTMVVQCPWWMGPPETRPPHVPKEAHFRPITTIVLAAVDVLNAMNTKPGDFQRVGHDYRADMRETLERTFGLSADADQRRRIDEALRVREREWAARRLVARTYEKTADTLRKRLNEWGKDTVNLEVDMDGGDAAPYRLMEYLQRRFGSGPEGAAEDAEALEEQEEPQ